MLRITGASKSHDVPGCSSPAGVPCLAHSFNARAQNLKQVLPTLTRSWSSGLDPAKPMMKRCDRSAVGMRLPGGARRARDQEAQWGCHEYHVHSATADPAQDDVLHPPIIDVECRVGGYVQENSPIAAP